MIITALAALLVAIWAIGLAKSETAGGLIHVLLVVAVTILVVRFLRKRRADKLETEARAKKRRDFQRKMSRW